MTTDSVTSLSPHVWVISLTNHPPKCSSANAWMSGQRSMSMASNDWLTPCCCCCCCWWEWWGWRWWAVAEQWTYGHTERHWYTTAYSTTWHTHTHPFNSPLSGSTRVSQYQKGKTNLDFTEARDSEWQWHQLGHMQVCTSLQTDKHASSPQLKFFTCRMPFLSPNQQSQSTEGAKWKCAAKSNAHLMAFFPGQPGQAGTRKAKTSLDLNEARDDGFLGCSGISWTICKQSVPHSRQITTPTPYYSIFYRPDALPDTQLTVSKLWRHYCTFAVHRVQTFAYCTVKMSSNSISNKFI